MGALAPSDKFNIRQTALHIALDGQERAANGERKKLDPDKVIADARKIEAYLIEPFTEAEPKVTN